MKKVYVLFNRNNSFDSCCGDHQDTMLGVFERKEEADAEWQNYPSRQWGHKVVVWVELGKLDACGDLCFQEVK